MLLFVTSPILEISHLNIHTLGLNFIEIVDAKNTRSDK
jgi:hypothetical protein